MQLLCVDRLQPVGRDRLQPVLTQKQPLALVFLQRIREAVAFEKRFLSIRRVAIERIHGDPGSFFEEKARAEGGGLERDLLFAFPREIGEKHRHGMRERRRLGCFRRRGGGEKNDGGKSDDAAAKHGAHCMTDVLIDGPEGEVTLVLAHGAGGGMRSSFMQGVAGDVSTAGIRVVRFEFDYMAAGKKRPDPAKTLQENWRTVVGQLGGGHDLFIGGKSLGGRMASMVADELSVRGLVCLGYPFHPPGQPDKLRTAHLKMLATPTLIVQGTKDAFGTRTEVSGYELSPRIQVEWIEGADHSFRNRDHIAKTVAAVVRFITSG